MAWLMGQLEEVVAVQLKRRTSQNERKYGHEFPLT